MILRDKIAAGHGRRDLGDVADLAGQVAGHRVHGVGEILPGSGHAGHLRLAAQFAVRSHFARHARHFGGEHAQLLNHRVDDVGGAQELAFQRTPIHVQPHRLGQISLRDGGDRARHFRGRPQQIFHQRVDRDFHLAPRASGLVEARALAGLALFADHLPDALQFLRHLLVGGDDFVERVGDFPRQPRPGSRQPHRKIAVAHGLQAGQDDRQIQRSVRIFRFTVGGFPVLRRAGRQIFCGRAFIQYGFLHCFSQKKGHFNSCFSRISALAE